MKEHALVCKNCGYAVPSTEDLRGFIFHQGNDGRSMLRCPACKSTTIQQTHDGGHTGNFLLIRSHIKQ